MLLTKKGLNLCKNAKIFILGVFLSFWARFSKNSPGLETLNLHFDHFELLELIHKSPTPHTAYTSGPPLLNTSLTSPTPDFMQQLIT
jgi:hypothetical protein